MRPRMEDPHPRIDDPPSHIEACTWKAKFPKRVVNNLIRMEDPHPGIDDPPLPRLGFEWIEASHPAYVTPHHTFWRLIPLDR